MDYYSILGVKPDATLDEVRAACLARVRACHPDRIDEQRQPRAWKQANSTLAQLNVHVHGYVATPQA